MSNASFRVHDVDHIEVTAATAPRDGGFVCWWQTLTFFDRDGVQLGEVVAFLKRPEAALPIGDQPPYWGMDLSKPAGLMDGESPF
ncbi:MAG: hypothetical protein EOM91_22430 [Sphingobacteriia bacterium]|nr:hypothetical protein [Sphingobacteriia bacterium]